MILAGGQLYEDRQLAQVLAGLEERCHAALSGEGISPETVIAACERLVEQVEAGEYDQLIARFLKDFQVSRRQFQGALDLFRRESLTYQCRMAWGENWRDLPPLRHAGHPDIRRRRMPLGVLFHIAAGNVDGLPAYSVVEGLLAGNINLLKLPSADRGLSVLLLHRLVSLEPALADYVYVFDVPSTDLKTLTRLAALADGVVVWGGDEAVQAAYRMVDCHTRVIPWGHKLSFAYAVPPVEDGDLRALARHIRETNQLLCSSCQGIFLDTDDQGELEAFGRRFLTILEEEGRDLPKIDPALGAKPALYLYNDQLEAHWTGRKILRGSGVSVTVCPDRTLELSRMWGNCWVKALPRNEIVRNLKGCKGLLQTCGLLCPPEERETVEKLLARAGLVRITQAGEMSRAIPGEAHDGVYPLIAYTRVVEMG